MLLGFLVVREWGPAEEAILTNIYTLYIHESKLAGVVQTAPTDTSCTSAS